MIRKALLLKIFDADVSLFTSAKYLQKATSV